MLAEVLCQGREGMVIFVAVRAWDLGSSHLCVIRLRDPLG